MDGLRGVAALVVVITHGLIASSTPLAGAFLASGPGVQYPDFAWLLIYTPLHAIWAGQEAVIVFFVLSGYVLSLPAARGGGFRLLSYYPKRLVRLYIPVWGAVGVGAILHLAAARHPGPHTTWWLAGHAEPMTGHAALKDMEMIRGSGGSAFDAVLWTLQWELLFSLLLPAYLVACAITRRVPALAVALTAGAFAMIATAPHFSWRHYMPMFLLGSLIAYHHASIGAVAKRLLRRGAAQAAAGALCIALLTASWWVAGGYSGNGAGLGRTLAAAGGALAIVLALFLPAFSRFLRRREVHWLGKRSFSLYLVHEPVLVTLAFANGGAPDPALMLIVGLPVVLVATEVFFRVVEWPSHRLSRRVGRALAPRGQRVTPVASASDSSSTRSASTTSSSDSSTAPAPSAATGRS